MQLIEWPGPEDPSAAAISDIYRNEGLRPISWSNGPGDRYAEHTHSYHKVLYCVRGSITFDVSGDKLSMKPGDRLELPPGTPHAAVVGPEGVTCYEGHR